MSIPSIQSSEEVNNSKSPVSLQELKDLFTQEISKLENVSNKQLKLIIQNVLEKLQDKSSKFKFILNLTKVSSKSKPQKEEDEEEEEEEGKKVEPPNVEIVNSVGFLWDDSTDGSYNFILQLDQLSSLVVNFTWILINEN